MTKPKKNDLISDLNLPPPILAGSFRVSCIHSNFILSFSLQSSETLNLELKHFWWQGYV